MSMKSVGVRKVPVIDLAATGRNIARLRAKAGISVRDLQAVMGFTHPQAIYKWQHGCCLPSVDNLVILAAVFGTTVDDILVCEDESSDNIKHRLSIEPIHDLLAQLVERHPVKVKVAGSIPVEIANVEA